MTTARTTNANRERADAHAAERAARREHRRLSREKLGELRKKLKAALKARTQGWRGIVVACRAQRLMIRDALQEKRLKAIQDVRERAQKAREIAHEACVAKKKEAKETCDTAVAYARAALAAEKQQGAAEQRITREEHAQIATVERDHENGAVHHHTMRGAMLGQFGPLYERVRYTPPGESRAEAVLRYAEAHPAEAHAVLEPAVERAITETQAKIAEVERSADAPTASQLAHAHRSHVARKRARSSPVKLAPPPPPSALGRVSMSRGVAVNENADDLRNRYAVRWTAPGGRTSWVLREDRGDFAHLHAWVGPREEAEKRARALNAKSTDGTVYEAQVFTGVLERERLLGLARRPQPTVKAPELEDTADIAKRIREDIKAAVAAKKLPKARYSVRTETYSMGSTIHVEASKLPFPVMNPAAFYVRKGESWVSFDSDHFTSRFTPEAQGVLKKLEAIVGAYHWDRSDPVTDYYNERFHRDVRITEDAATWKAIEAAKLEAARRDR